MIKQFLTVFPLVLLASFAVASCDIPSQIPASDGYSFGTPSFERTKVEVQLVTYKTRVDFLEAARKRNVKGNEVQAFTELRSPFNKCTIHVMDPNLQYQPEFIGHELAHCFYGQWHTSNSDRK
jgi:hypothetical protein